MMHAFWWWLREILSCCMPASAFNSHHSSTPLYLTQADQNSESKSINFRINRKMFYKSVVPLIITVKILCTLLPFSHAKISPIAKPGCADSCGGITIPFPFGTTPECYLNYSFWVTCNNTFNPPKLFSQDTSVEIAELSLAGQLKMMHYIASNCYSSGNQISYFGTSLQLPTYLTVNKTANKFTVVGCDSYAFISGWRLDDRKYFTGCTAVCNSEEDLSEGSCTGSGCCQTSIPGDVSEVDIEPDTYNNYTDVSDFNTCGYAFLVEESAFTFFSDNLTNLASVDKLPIVVDWSIGNATCEEASTDSSSYACVSDQSTCYKPENVHGYRCRCLDGYGGTAYLDLGCQDIDECASSSLHDCMKNEYCANTEGNYTCSCPKGYSGDGRGRHGCTRKRYAATPYVLIGVAFGITALLVAAILCYMEFKRRSSKTKRQKFFHDNGGFLLQEKLSTRQRSPDSVKIFSSSELHKATNAFHSSMIVGQGGFGTVYRGELSDKSIVAIKKSKKVDPTQIEQFINEVFVLSQVNHRNVVRLLGCCLETEAPLLVYELISNGALSAHLHNKAKACFLSWNARLRIAAETAGVLSYLHSAASTPIIHRDVKPDNILLDKDFTAKVSDFGASKLIPLDITQLSTMVQGTFGYLDPEYMQTSQLTEKSDVYSFGVVLLELLTGRKAISFDKPEQEKNLANFFLSMLSKKRLREILDENIAGDMNMEHAWRVARLAKECLNVKGEGRPSMKEVAMELEGLILGGKHSWTTNGNADERQTFLVEEGLITVPDNAEVTGTNTGGFDCIWSHFLLPVNRGR